MENLNFNFLVDPAFNFEKEIIRSIHDNGLSWKAKGIFCALCKMAEIGCDNYNSGIFNLMSLDDEEATSSGFRELEERGYLMVQRKRDAEGKVERYIWWLTV